jgi:membrane-associated phospholipid phosphatase
VTLGQQIVADVTHPLVLGAVLLLAALHLAHSRSVRGALRLVGAVVLAWVVAHALKFLVGDPRPDGGAIDAWGSGWPSGHSAVGAAAALALWFVFSPAARSRPRRALLAVALVAGAILLAASRLYLGVHDLGDLAGGLSVGVLAGYLLRPRREK